MRSGLCTSNIGYLRSLRLLAVAVCLWPAIAGAQQTYNPTANSISGNTAAGTGAVPPSSAGQYNTAIGGNALSTNTGSNNTASGFNALYSNTAGNENTASGVNALVSNDTGDRNTAIGNSALYYNTSGSYNTASGYSALGHNTTGESNTASGYQALDSNTRGNNNTALGNEALFTNTRGGNNTAVGTGALSQMNGSNNIAVGFNAGKNTTSGNNNIYIGHTGRNGSESRVIRIGKAQTKTFIDGIAGVPLSGATVVVRSTGQLGVVASSARYKQDIRPLGDASDKLARLRPVSYHYKTEPQAMHYGLIAEEVDKVMPELVVRDDQNRPERVQYLEIIPLLLQERREQQARIEKQQLELTRQRALVKQLAAEVAEIRRTRLASNTAPKN